MSDSKVHIKLKKIGLFTLLCITTAILSSCPDGNPNRNVETKWITLPAGTFTMGCSEDKYAPVHKVTLTNSFEMCDHEVTQGEWKSVMGSLPEGIRGMNKWVCYPVSHVSWYDAVKYCNKLSEKEGLTAAYTINGTDVTWNRRANGYRLPTEAEWEYAARAGDTTTDRYTWSGTTDKYSLYSYASYARYGNSYGEHLKDVKTNKPNALGLYDMSGSVQEWCWDVSRTDSSDSVRVIRGGSYVDDEIQCAVSSRFGEEPDNDDYRFGFRVVRSHDDDWVTIPAGTFMMGNSEAENVHKVTITQPFEMCDHEVTQGEWKAVMGSLPDKDSMMRSDSYPVNYVSWYDVVKYCNALSTQEGLTAVYIINGTDVTWNKTANGYRLPTEAEWEYAARAGDGTTDEARLEEYAWYGERWYYNKEIILHEVKTKKPNAWGLYDMSGNVQELCYDSEYLHEAHAIRGGCTCGNAPSCNISSWNYGFFSDTTGQDHIGFRVARSIDGGSSSYDSGNVMDIAGKPSDRKEDSVYQVGFVKIPKGKFSMGCSIGRSIEKPVHEVTLTRSFLMCDHEVTQTEFKSVMGELPSSTLKYSSDYPVSYVNWYQAITYCNKRSIAEGFTPCYAVDGIEDWTKVFWNSIPISDETWDAATCNFDADGYRLPTEAEWEYAARAGNSTTNSLIWSGTTSENSIEDYAWYRRNSILSVHSVKQKIPNEFYLYDMSGNVFEWCWDSYNTYNNEAVTDPTGAKSGAYRMARGGAYSRDASYCTVSYRQEFGAGDPRDVNGFRVVRTIPEK